jgi:hypothetical protein
MTTRMTLTARAAAGALAAFAAVACAAEKPEERALAKATDDASALAEAPKAEADTDDFHSIKVGAAVDVSHAQAGAVDPGAVGVASFTMTEPYDGGTMTVTAAGSSGLELIPPAPSTTVSLATGNSHRWDVSFRAQNAGAYYIDLTISVTSPNGTVEMRSYSARVDVGSGGATQKAVVKTDTIDGEPVVVMDAQETVND